MKTRSISNRFLVLVACCGAWIVSARAHAQTVARLDLAAGVATLVAQPDTQRAPPPSLDSSPRHSFTQEGSHWGTFGFGATQSFTGNSTGLNTTFSYSYFLIDGVEAVGELGGWYYNQKGPNAFGINPSAVLRWHFWRAEDLKTTVYFDAGIGVALFTDQVPNGGTSFDFTPRFGFGLTRQITDEGWRLQAGLRWNHVSNARILGDHRNPARDGPLLYFGLIVPF